MRFENKNKSYIVFGEFRNKRGILHLHLEAERIKDLISGLISVKDGIYYLNSKPYFKHLNSRFCSSTPFLLNEENLGERSFKLELYSKEFCEQICESFDDQNLAFNVLDGDLEELFRWAAKQFDVSFPANIHNPLFSSAMDLLSLLCERAYNVLSVRRFGDVNQSYLAFVEYFERRGFIHLYRETKPYKDINGLMSPESYSSWESYHINSYFSYEEIKPEHFQKFRNDFGIFLQPEITPSLVDKETCQHALEILIEFPYETPQRTELLKMYKWALEQFNDIQFGTA